MPAQGGIKLEGDRDKVVRLRDGSLYIIIIIKYIIVVYYVI